jgi:hypothetical protein
LRNGIITALDRTGVDLRFLRPPVGGE